MGGAVGVENAAAGNLEEDEHVEVRSRTVSTVKKSQARVAIAWALRNWAQVGPSASWCRRHAMATEDAADGGRRDSVAELEQLALNAAIAPTGFSRAKRRIHSRSSAEIGGRPRPGRKRKAGQCLRTSSRCQRSNVPGEKSKRSGDSLRPMAEMIIRSASSRSGIFT